VSGLSLAGSHGYIHFFVISEAGMKFSKTEYLPASQDELCSMQWEIFHVWF
jgi:hypothetical protein